MCGTKGCPYSISSTSKLFEVPTLNLVTSLLVSHTKLNMRRSTRLRSDISHNAAADVDAPDQTATSPVSEAIDVPMQDTEEIEEDDIRRVMAGEAEATTTRDAQSSECETFAGADAARSKAIGVMLMELYEEANDQCKKLVSSFQLRWQRLWCR